MVSNTIRQMRENKVTVGAIVTGGFHTKGITGILQSDKVSYLILLPRFDSKKEKRPYITIFTNKASEYKRYAESGDYLAIVSRLAVLARVMGEVLGIEKEEVAGEIIAELLAATAIKYFEEQGERVGAEELGRILAEYLKRYNKQARDKSKTLIDSGELKEILDSVVILEEGNEVRILLKVGEEYHDYVFVKDKDGVLTLKKKEIHDASYSGIFSKLKEKVADKTEKSKAEDRGRKFRERVSTAFNESKSEEEFVGKVKEIAKRLGVYNDQVETDAKKIYKKKKAEADQGPQLAVDGAGGGGTIIPPGSILDRLRKEAERKAKEAVEGKATAEEVETARKALEDAQEMVKRFVIRVYHLYVSLEGTFGENGVDEEGFTNILLTMAMNAGILSKDATEKEIDQIKEWARALIESGRMEHERRHAEHRAIILSLAEELGLELGADGMYDFKGFMKSMQDGTIKLENGTVITKKNGRITITRKDGSRTELRTEDYTDEDGETYELLAVIDSRITAGHAGRGQLAMYANSESGLAHERRELTGLIKFAKMKGVATAEEIRNGMLGTIIRHRMGVDEDFYNDVMDEMDRLHIEGLKAERDQLRKEGKHTEAEEIQEEIDNPKKKPTKRRKWEKDGDNDFTISQDGETGKDEDSMTPEIKAKLDEMIAGKTQIDAMTGEVEKSFRQIAKLSAEGASAENLKVLISGVQGLLIKLLELVSRAETNADKISDPKKKEALKKKLKAQRDLINVKIKNAEDNLNEINNEINKRQKPQTGVMGLLHSYEFDSKHLYKYIGDEEGQVSEEEAINILVGVATGSIDPKLRENARKCLARLLGEDIDFEKEMSPETMIKLDDAYHDEDKNDRKRNGKIIIALINSGNIENKESAVHKNSKKMAKYLGDLNGAEAVLAKLGFDISILVEKRGEVEKYLEQLAKDGEEAQEAREKLKKLIGELFEEATGEELGTLLNKRDGENDFAAVIENALASKMEDMKKGFEEQKTKILQIVKENDLKDFVSLEEKAEWIRILLELKG